MTVIRILIAATLMTPVLGTAQTAPSPEWPVSAGSYVRIESSVLGSGFHKGNVVAATSDTLLFQPKGAAPAMPIATPNIVKLELASGQRSHKARGALLGLLIGAGVGAAIGAASYKKTECVEICVFLPDSRSFDATVGAVLLGGVGAIIGTVVGAHPTDKWVPVAVPRR